MRKIMSKIPGRIGQRRITCTACRQEPVAEENVKVFAELLESYSRIEGRVNDIYGEVGKNI